MTAEEKLKGIKPMDCHICPRCGKGVPSSHWCLPEHTDLEELLMRYASSFKPVIKYGNQKLADAMKFIVR